MRILIVEDSTMQAKFLRGMLESMGHEPRIAPHGDEAWRILQDEPIPLVLSDWVMPGLDGPSLCRRIRERQGGSYTYVILLTALGRRSDRMEGLRAGADDFLVKPVDTEELAARLEIARRILDMQARLEWQNAATRGAGRDRRADRAEQSPRVPPGPGGRIRPGEPAGAPAVARAAGRRPLQVVQRRVRAPGRRRGPPRGGRGAQGPLPRARHGRPSRRRGVRRGPARVGAGGGLRGRRAAPSRRGREAPGGVGR